MQYRQGKHQHTWIDASHPDDGVIAVQVRKQIPCALCVPAAMYLGQIVKFET